MLRAAERNPEEKEPKEENESPENPDNKRRKTSPLLKLPSSQLLTNSLLPSVKAEEEEVVRDNSDLLF
jgi:hypothetical protein